MARRMLPFLLCAALGAAQDKPGTPVDFYRDVRPIFSVHCAKCHSADAAKGGLRLDTREHTLKGGDTGAAIVPGKIADSLLFQRVTTKDKKERMPSKAEALEAKEIDTLRRWIAEGAAWPDAAEIVHWAFRPPVRPAVPAVKNSAWVRTPVDAFVAKEQEARGLVPSAEAGRRALIRRVTLDLTGLPPAPEDFEGGYEETVERLLASPAYGERWGRHWLDLVRWAETSGYEANALRPAAWRYRDYVVQCFNEDRPYDAFLRQQIAGDELQPLSDENLVATGFLAHGRLDINQEDRLLQRNDHLLDITNMMSTVLFGLSMGCAQCHDHKWDPITQKDYYRLQAFFVRGQVINVLIQDPAAWAAYEKSVPPELEASKTYQKALLDAARTRLLEEAKKKAPEATITKDQILKAASDDDRKLFAELDKKIRSLEEKLPEKPHAWSFYSPATGAADVKTMPIKGMYPMPYEPAKLRETPGRLLKRGDCHQPGEEVAPGWPAVLGETPKAATTRRALADWLTRPDHPTVTRMFVNFVWQRHFGRALVPTTGDFGLRGERPTHPELLDWLASEFVAKGWSLKALHRLIVLSSTYRQASSARAANAAIDAENRWLWRWSPRRLEAEAIRDSILSASGELNRAMGGKSVVEEQPTSDPKQLRRTLYLLQKRSHLPEIEELFDAPIAGESCPMRHVSTVSLQPLYLMNSPFVHGRAQAFAKRAGSVAKAFEIALGRPPSPAELEAAAGLDLASLCHALFNLNEFVYVE
ncbi:MAG: PSD1 domain-containing protein [Planctomycetes bacterium]|nr:PSD1 domain-containing protein [Planctomycetota bacterium]